MDMKMRAQLAAIDPNNRVDGKPVPVLTTLLFGYCGEDEARFERLCELISIIQDRTIDIIRAEG